MSEFRIEKDTMGDVRVPADALWGAQTQRAVENFPVSGIRFSRRFIRALGLVKQAAAEANRELGLLKPDIAELIAQAAGEIADGAYDDHFPIDIFQTGSGTSMNMNANEVIANVANERTGAGRGAKEPVHPNNHPNMCQSSNDVIPAVIHIAALDAIRDDLLPALERLERSLRAKAGEFAGVVKTGRTHLMDAVPVTLGQELGGYARQVELGRERLGDVLPRLGELALGGTAVGTGLNAHPDFARMTIALVASRTGLPLRETSDHFEAQGAQDAAVEASGALKTVASSLCKIANDLRWLGSGPDAGIAEIRLPDLQPGSSIMPGKVNPVIPEVVIQVAAQVFGCDTAITFGGATGDLELNVRLPMMAHNLLQQIALLTSAAGLLAERCIDGLEANADRCRELVEATTSVVTALNPAIGYDRAAALFKEAKRTGRSVRELALEQKVLPTDELERALDVMHMTKGGILSSG